MARSGWRRSGRRPLRCSSRTRTSSGTTRARFTINNKDTIIFSGAFHYPRCPQALWRDRLAKLKAAGFNTVETYVFWNYHEPEKGKGNLTAFEEFVKLAGEMGFWMIARPGPYVCAEWERGGFPDWVATMRFPLRSNHAESIKTSQHWYSQVLPVIQRHQITVGGPIIMVQVENEYDFSPPMPDGDKREYIRALANMVWQAGITVPVISCWTRQARENSDPDMARIMDTCNFYPRWDIVKEVVPALQQLRAQEPASPLAVTELQGGWFSQFGGKLSVDQEGVNAQQLDTLTKTVLSKARPHSAITWGSAARISTGPPKRSPPPMITPRPCASRAGCGKSTTRRAESANFSGCMGTC